MDNPLMADEDSKWSKHFEAQELIDEIKNDIDRTYPEFEFFRLESTRKILTQILHIWAAMHPRISYKQGMNELLAPIVYVMSLEYFDVKAAAAGGEVGVIESLLDLKYLEHDAFSLFETVMDSMEILFDTDRPDVKTMSTAMRAQMNEMGGDRGANPSVWRCRQVHSLLEKVDNTLYKHIHNAEIQPQLYALKWMRLLFSREFHLEDTLVIWDTLFVAGPDLKLLDYYAIAMLLYIRNDILQMDDTMMLLGRLMKFPPVESVVVLGARARELAGPSIGNSKFGSHRVAQKPGIGASNMFAEPPPSAAAAVPPAEPTPVVPEPAPEALAPAKEEVAPIAPPQLTPTPVAEPAPEKDEGLLAGITDTIESAVSKGKDLFGDDSDEDPMSNVSKKKSGALDLFGGGSSSKESLFDSPRSPGGDSDVGSLFSDGAPSLDGPVTFRKMETSTFGTGSDAASGAGYPDLSKKPSSDGVAAAVIKPDEAVKKMQALVDSGAANAEALALLKGVIQHFEKS